MIEWKFIKGYEDYYKISSDGKIISCGRYRNGKNNCKILINEKLLKFKYDKDGYQSCSLSKNRIKKYLRVHRLVAISFIENSENKLQVNHKNGIRNDNRMENLEWCTEIENKTHRKNELKTYDIGSNHAMSKLSENDVLEIRKLYKEGFTQKKLGEKFKIRQNQISNIILRIHWKHI